MVKKKDKVDWLILGIMSGIITVTISCLVWWAGFIMKKSEISHFGEGMFMVGAVLVFLCSFLLSDEFRRLPEAAADNDQSVT